MEKQNSVLVRGDELILQNYFTTPGLLSLDKSKVQSVLSFVIDSKDMDKINERRLLSMLTKSFIRVLYVVPLRHNQIDHVSIIAEQSSENVPYEESKVYSRCLVLSRI